MILTGKLKFKKITSVFSAIGLQQITQENHSFPDCSYSYLPVLGGDESLFQAL